MARQPRSVDEVLSRTSDYFARLDAHPGTGAAPRRGYGRSARSVGRRVATIAMAVGGLLVAAMAFGLFVSPIGWTGLFVLALAIMCVLVFFSAQPLEKPMKPYSDSIPNPEIVRTLDSYLRRRRTALPSPAAQQLDAISSQLPLLESRLQEVPLLDPLAQDARRLMGKHLPELIDRYERIPASHRRERDGEGMTVDERLVASLGAAREALDDIGRKLTREDLNAFETQGRFIESRYKDGADIQRD